MEVGVEGAAAGVGGQIVRKVGGGLRGCRAANRSIPD